MYKMQYLFLSCMEDNVLLMNYSYLVAVYFKAPETNQLACLFVVGKDPIDTIGQTTDG